ncbi:ATP-binding cassette domain-containing protein [Hymenobacter sp. RP-2-7]|uniref:ATP-binding cassette domain-containing protein n=1 Tax=Hymenobacter polaris TaxID=2682546 RepID=A0A7Y0ADR2_9BACT|nr:ATP-binding cassette domain-containing protein [Hymenobacter polaris]NML65327.1 ATP-binding cassette domain-containing protein [Hymenobacter polaris]
MKNNYLTGGPHVLEADGIRVLFDGRPVLTDIYLRVQTGQIVGLLGRNGSGKSTLLQTIFGARPVPDASVRVNGRRAVPAFQTPGLLNYLPQAAALPASLPLGRAARLLQVDAEAATANFPELRPQLAGFLHELSGGSARLLQALLLLHAPTAFSLLDEPFSGVMPLHVEALAREMQALKVRKGLVITDHRYEAVLAVSDVVYLLHQGRLRQLAADPWPELRDYGYVPA